MSVRFAVSVQTVLFPNLHLTSIARGRKIKFEIEMVQPMEGPNPMWLVARGICCFAVGLAVGYTIGKQEVQKMTMKNGPPSPPPNSAGLSSLSVNPISTRGGTYHAYLIATGTHLQTALKVRLN